MFPHPPLALRRARPTRRRSSSCSFSFPRRPAAAGTRRLARWSRCLRSEKLIGGAQITNVAGAGGIVGLPQFVNQWKGRPNALMVAGMVMVGAIITNKSPLKLTNVTPIARLTGEFEVIVVPADSPFKTRRIWSRR